MEPWKYYLDRLGERVGRTPPNLLGREDLIAEAAHEAYQSTTNRLTAEGWDEEEAITVTRMFGQTVKHWLDTGNRDWDDLADRTREAYERWVAGEITEG